MVAVTLVGAILRFYDLPTVPPGFYFDEAANIADLLRLGPDYHPLYFAANNGREALYFYWAWPFVEVLGGGPLALRLASAFIGIATLPAAYLCLSQLLRHPLGRQRARIAAMFGAAILAALFMHLHFSRFGLRTITLPLIECLAFAWLWKAFRKPAWWRLVLAGVLFAATLYTYTAARLLVPLLALYGLLLLLRRPDRRHVRSVLLWLIGAILGAFPLLLYAAANAATFQQRTEGLVQADGPALLANGLAMLRLWFLQGSLNPAQNVPGLPLFDWPAAIPFVLGLVLALWRLRRAPEYAFLLLWIGAIATGSVLSPDAPYYIRLTGLLPPAVGLAGLGLVQLQAWLAASARRWARGVWTWAPSAALVALSIVLGTRHYFAEWAPSTAAYYGMMQHKVDAAAYLRQAVAAGDRVFLGPLYAQDWTFQVLDRDLGVESFDPSDCWIVPAAAGVSYAFPPYDITQPARLLANLSPLATQRTIVNHRQAPVLTEVRLTQAGIPSDPVAGPIFLFGAAVELRPHELPGMDSAPGTVARVVLEWRAVGPPAADYTTYLHADDAEHGRRLQQDHLPCGGSVPSTRWRVGDRVFDVFQLAIPADAQAGVYQLTAGLYEQPGVRNLRLASGGTEARLGTLRVGPPALSPAAR